MTDPEAQLRNALLDLGHVQAFEQFRTAADPAAAPKTSVPDLSTLTDNARKWRRLCFHRKQQQCQEVTNTRRSSPSVAVRSRPDARFPRVAGGVEQSGAERKQAPALESSLGPRSSPEDATIAYSRNLRAATETCETGMRWRSWRQVTWPVGSLAYAGSRRSALGSTVP